MFNCLLRQANVMSFIVAHSFNCSLNRDETVAGKVEAEQTGLSQLELEPTDSVACRHCCQQKRVRTRPAY